MLKFLKYTGIVLGSILFIAFVLLATGVGDAPEPDYTPIVDPVVADEDNGYVLFSKSLDVLLSESPVTEGKIKTRIDAIEPAKLEAFYSTLQIALAKPYWVKPKVELLKQKGYIQEEISTHIILERQGELALAHQDLNSLSNALEMLQRFAEVSGQNCQSHLDVVISLNALDRCFSLICAATHDQQLSKEWIEALALYAVIPSSIEASVKRGYYKQYELLSAHLDKCETNLLKWNQITEEKEVKEGYWKSLPYFLQRNHSKQLVLDTIRWEEPQLNRYFSQISPSDTYWEERFASKIHIPYLSGIFRYFVLPNMTGKKMATVNHVLTHSDLTRLIEMKTKKEAAQLTLQLERYQLEHQELPESLEDLQAFTNQPLAIDWFNGESFHYSKEQQCFWSVGTDLNNNQGRLKVVGYGSHRDTDVVFNLRSQAVIDAEEEARRAAERAAREEKYSQRRKSRNIVPKLRTTSDITE